MLIDILGTKEIDGNLHYRIRITRNVNNKVFYKEIYKRYSNLCDVYERLLT